MKIDIIGDIHGCFTEFKQLTERLGYDWETGIPLHKQGRKLGFVGDLTDRGPQSIKVIEIVWELAVHRRGILCSWKPLQQIISIFPGQ